MGSRLRCRNDSSLDKRVKGTVVCGDLPQTIPGFFFCVAAILSARVLSGAASSRDDIGAAIPDPRQLVGSIFEADSDYRGSHVFSRTTTLNFFEDRSMSLLD